MYQVRRERDSRRSDALCALQTAITLTPAYVGQEQIHVSEFGYIRLSSASASVIRRCIHRSIGAFSSTGLG